MVLKGNYSVTDSLKNTLSISKDFILKMLKNTLSISKDLATVGVPFLFCFDVINNQDVTASKITI